MDHRRRLLREAAQLTDEQRATLHEKLTSADLTAISRRGGYRRKFFEMCCPETIVLAFVVPGIRKLAATISTWQKPMILAIITGLSNARSEGYNRIVKHVGRIAFGFRTSENQRPPGMVGLPRRRWAGCAQSEPMPLLAVKSRVWQPVWIP